MTGWILALWIKLWEDMRKNKSDGKMRLTLGILGLRRLKDVQVEISWNIRPELRWWILWDIDSIWKIEHVLCARHSSNVCVVSVNKRDENPLSVEFIFPVDRKKEKSSNIRSKFYSILEVTTKPKDNRACQGDWEDRYKGVWLAIFSKGVQLRRHWEDAV